VKIGKYEIKRVIEKIIRHDGVVDFFFFFYFEFKLTVFNPLVKKSCTLCDGDVIIDKILGNSKSGFYVDVGAYDPWVGSNTKRFYEKGWSGVIVAPDTRRHKRFLIERKEDINLNVGLADKKAKLIFYVMFSESLSTFSK